MAKAKIILLAVILPFLTTSCSYHYSWEKAEMNGERTGVTATTADNVGQALGSVNDSIYIAPNGRVFRKGSATYAVASDMIGIQPQMHKLKEVIGYSPAEMTSHRPESALSNWFVDRLMVDVAVITQRKVDVGIVNFGGIRADMPEGDVLIDDIVSMFPFHNNLCYTALQGSDLLEVFEKMAAGSVQVLGGVKLVIDRGKIDTLLVGGNPIDPDRVYGIATIDFLLDGGDDLSLAKNSQELIITDVQVSDAMLPYARSFALAGQPIEYHTDGRVVVKR